MSQYNSETLLSAVRGIGDARCALFAKLGLFTVGDLVYHFPKKYENRGDIKCVSETYDGQLCSMILTIDTELRRGQGKSGIVFFKLSASDITGAVSITFFNQNWIPNAIFKGRTYRFFGKIIFGIYGREMINPIAEAIVEWKKLDDIIPVYRTVKGLSGKIISDIVKSSLSSIMEEELFDDDLRHEYSILKKNEYLKILHFPQTDAELAAAKRSAAFEELLIFQLAIRIMKLNTVKRQSYSINLKNTSVSSFFSSLPFDLTNAQKRVVKEIFTDIEKDKAMTRIVQGDVGSGKTAVAASAIYICAKNGYQAAMMAPTEVLASQHFKSLTKMFDGFGIKTELLTGSMTVKSKKDIYTRLLNGEIDVLIGTHAIFQSSVEYKNLALVVTDEQHRFGVMQRAALSDKGQNALQPHTLVMSATPIPRTLSLVIYGDLDISILDEYPVGRQKIDTFFVDESYRQRIISFLKKELSAGHQAFIICPLIEESETNDYDDKKSVVEYIKKIEPLFAPYSIGMVHGKQKPAEKNEAMRKFHDNESQILVSTTVVEVGVDVPNATVMLIENAECFGLSQLHQLRGRVGRGTAKSYCVLMSDIKNEKSRERLDVMVSTNDGFEIAEADLATRGPGDFFGSRQSGALVFKSASIADFELIELTKKLVEKLSNDTEYYNKYPALTHAVNSFLEHMKTDNTFN